MELWGDAKRFWEWVGFISKNSEIMFEIICGDTPIAPGLDQHDTPFYFTRERSVVAAPVRKGILFERGGGSEWLRDWSVTRAARCVGVMFTRSCRFRIILPGLGPIGSVPPTMKPK